MVKKTITNKNSRNRQFKKLTISEIPCLRCGTCCKKYQPRLSVDEAHLLADKLGVNWDRFVAEYTDPKWPGVESFLIRQENGVCLFLRTSADKKQHLCDIHSFKPACCRDWQSGLDKPECRSGLLANWGLTVDSSNNVCGEPEKLEALDQFIQSLKE